MIDFLLIAPLKEGVKDPPRRAMREERQMGRMCGSTIMLIWRRGLLVVNGRLSSDRYVSAGLDGRTATATADAIRRWQPRLSCWLGLRAAILLISGLSDVLIAEQFVDYERKRR